MKICVIGTGYVGLVSGVCFSDLGNIVYCVDIDKKKIESLNNGNVPIYEPGLDEILKRNYKQKRLIFTTDLKNAVNNSDIIFGNIYLPITALFDGAFLMFGFSITSFI